MSDPTAPWPLAAAPADYTVRRVRAVLPDRIVDDARVVVRDGLIAAVGPDRPVAVGRGPVVDGGGLLLIAGLVDLHSDALLGELRPRPNSTVPVGFAITGAAARLRGAGVTTAHHGLAYQARTAVGLPINSPGAAEVRPELVGRGLRVLHRLDVRCEAGLNALRAVVEAHPPGAAPLLVAAEDHTPGQGQYADPATMCRWLVTGEGFDEQTAADHVEWWQRSRSATDALHARTLTWLGEQVAARTIRLAGHDPGTTEDVERWRDLGAAIAEFPTTVAAARSAREHGLGVVAGAPNVIRGASHAGNVSATELVAAGLVDALASDYLPGAGLGAAFALARRGVCPLPTAVGLVTGGGARLAGLTDRGRLACGQRADLVLVDDRGAWPEVAAVLAVD